MGKHELSYKDGINIVQQMKLAGMQPDEASLFTKDVATEALAKIRLRYYEETKEEVAAKMVMQESFFGVPDVTKLLGITYHHADLREQTSIPSASVLADYKSNSLLAFGSTISIGSLKKSHPKLFHHNCPPLDHQNSSKHWIHMRRNLPVDFYSKSYDEQVKYAHLHHMQEMTVGNTVYASVLYHLRHGSFPFPTGTSLRTCSIEGGVKVMVTFDAQGIIVEHSTDGDRGRQIGLAVRILF